MKSSRLEQMVGGWFAGDFEPSVFRSSDFEAAVKTYVAGDVEPRHVHLRATEITVVLTGVVWMADRRWVAGDIVVLDRGEYSSFKAEEDAVLLVVKSPSVKGDKHLDPSART